MSMTSIQNGIVTKWTATGGLSSVKLQYGGADEGIPKPYATYFDILDSPDDAFNAAKVIDRWIFQFSVFDIDSDNVSALIDTIRTTFHRQSMTLSDGTMLACLRTGFGLIKEPKEDKNSQNVYHGWCRFKFIVDN